MEESPTYLDPPIRIPCSSLRRGQASHRSDARHLDLMLFRSAGCRLARLHVGSPRCSTCSRPARGPQDGLGFSTAPILRSNRSKARVWCEGGGELPSGWCRFHNAGLTLGELWLALHGRSLPPRRRPRGYRDGRLCPDAGPGFGCRTTGVDINPSPAITNINCVRCFPGPCCSRARICPRAGARRPHWKSLARRRSRSTRCLETMRALAPDGVRGAVCVHASSSRSSTS